MAPHALMGQMALLPGLLKDSRASTTVRKYIHRFDKWKLWALSNGLGSKDILPAKAFNVALYFASIIQIADSLSPLISAYYSLKLYHNLFELPSPVDSNLVTNILESPKTKLAKPVTKNVPIKVNLLTKVYSRLFCEWNVKNQPIICACLIRYTGFFRSN